MASSSKGSWSLSSLPPEITQEIFYKTPTDALVRSKPTCKKWKFRWVEPVGVITSSDYYGIGYSNSKKKARDDGYKIVRFTCGLEGNYEINVVPQVEIYEFKTNSWRTTGVKVDADVKITRKCVAVMGNMYWIAYKEEEEEEEFIRCFDFSDETFKYLMANPWFPDGNSASALSPLLLTTGDNRILIPPDPPDPDPDNPLSLTRFPPLNSPGSKTPKTSRRQSRQTLSSDPSRLNSTSTTLTFGLIQPIHQTMVSPSIDSRSESYVHHTLENFRVLPPKSSSPILSNKASNFSSTPTLIASPPATIEIPPKPSPSAPLPTNHVFLNLNPSSSGSVPKNLNTDAPQKAAPPLVERLHKSEDKTLRRLAPVTISDTGRPRVLIPDSVFQKGAELHKDFIICYFNGRSPPFTHIQNVLNHLWSKGVRVEIHTNPLSRSMLVRIPSDYLRQKILEKRVWYVGDSMFQAVQWTSSASSQSSPPLETIQIWAHLTDIPLDLRHQQGLSLVAGLVGEPKETDDFTLNLVSLTLSHVKVAVDLTKPLPSVVEFTRESGEVVEVLVSYPWVPPTCTHCKELGHIMRNCLQLPPPNKQAPPQRTGKAHVDGGANIPAAGKNQPDTSKNTPVRSKQSGGKSLRTEKASSENPQTLATQSAAHTKPSTSTSPPLHPSLPITPLEKFIVLSTKPPSPKPMPSGLNLPSPTSSLLPSQLLTLPFKLVSPPSPSDHPKKRPRQTSPSSTQQFSSFTAQLKFFSSSPALPALDPPVAKPFETLLLAQTPFLF
ncbi:unnamed protein product [Brassica oleracea]|uniref:(rape) hypothetical protein n=1 Tax=Brassica napus TaxID=3708 RepID=A0A816IEY2_BRANA|nr:unnamed protein product [Brassica napus]